MNLAVNINWYQVKGNIKLLLVIRSSLFLPLCTYQCKPRGEGVRARGGDLMPGTIPAVGLLIV